MEEKSLQVVPQTSFSLADIQTMAQAMSKSRLFPSCQTPENALALMLLCQSEGLHPVQAARRYHVINGTCTMRTDAMLAEFQRQGGTVAWLRYDDQEARAKFTHPSGGTIEFSYTIKEAQQAGLVRDGGNWKKFPSAMLRARCISGGIRMILPGIVCGIYTPEEIADSTEIQPPAPASSGIDEALKRKTRKAAQAPAEEPEDATPVPTAPTATAAPEAPTAPVVQDAKVEPPAAPEIEPVQAAVEPAPTRDVIINRILSLRGKHKILAGPFTALVAKTIGSPKINAGDWTDDEALRIHDAIIAEKETKAA